MNETWRMYWEMALRWASSTENQQAVLITTLLAAILVSLVLYNSGWWHRFRAKMHHKALRKKKIEEQTVSAISAAIEDCHKRGYWSREDTDRIYRRLSGAYSAFKFRLRPPTPLWTYAYRAWNWTWRKLSVSRPNLRFNLAFNFLRKKETKPPSKLKAKALSLRKA